MFLEIKLEEFSIFCGHFFIKRQIPLALVGYGMIIANSLVIYLLISNAHSWIIVHYFVEQLGLARNDEPNEVRRLA